MGGAKLRAGEHGRPGGGRRERKGEPGKGIRGLGPLGEDRERKAGGRSTGGEREPEREKGGRGGGRGREATTRQGDPTGKRETQGRGGGQRPQGRGN